MSAPETQRAGLVEQLKAAIDEDERIALAATVGPWRVNDEQLAERIYGPDNETVIGGSRWGGDAPVFDTTEDAIHGACPVCWRVSARSSTREDYPCPTLRALAKGYGIEVQE